MAILSPCCFLSANAWVNPLLHLIAQSFPEIDETLIMQVSTLPALISMIFVMLAGAFVGKKIKFVSTMKLGLCLLAAGGILLVLFRKSFAILIASRVITGAGTGLIGIRNSLIIRSFNDPQRTKVIGWVMLANSGFAVVAQQLSGVIGAKSWNNSFLIYLAALIPLALISAWGPEPEVLNEESSESLPKEKSNKIENRSKAYAAVIFVVMMSTYPATMGMSSYMHTKALGDSALAGTVLAFGTLSGALVGLFYNKMQEKLGKYIWTLMFFCPVIGSICILSAQNAVMLIL